MILELYVSLNKHSKWWRGESVAEVLSMGSGKGARELMLKVLTVDKTVIGHDFHPSFLVHFQSNFFTFLVNILFFPYVYLSQASSCSWQTTRTQFDWWLGYQTIYSQHWLLDHHMITWLQSPQNSPSLIQPPNPVLEPLRRPSLLPTNQSSGLPEHKVQVGVRWPYKNPDWSQGLSEVLQQDLPNLKLPFVEPHPWTFQRMSLFQLEQGSSEHQPPGSQWHHPTGSW